MSVGTVLMRTALVLFCVTQSPEERQPRPATVNPATDTDSDGDPAISLRYQMVRTAFSRCCTVPN
jgi:hypothetical protein